MEVTMEVWIVVVVVVVVVACRAGKYEVAESFPDVAAAAAAGVCRQAVMTMAGRAGGATGSTGTYRFEPEISTRENT